MDPVNQLLIDLVRDNIRVILNSQFNDQFSFLRSSRYLYFGINIGEYDVLYENSISILEHNEEGYVISIDRGSYYPCYSMILKVIVDQGKYKIVFDTDSYYLKPEGYGEYNGNTIIGHD